jgi:hypothetical protein
MGAVRKITVRADASNVSAYSPRLAVAARSGPDTTGQNTKSLPDGIHADRAAGQGPF